jgi:hypothetical protein
MEYDTKRLASLGKRMQRLREDVDALRPQLAEEILSALDAGVRQVDIVKMTGYTRDAIRQMARRAEP